MDFLDLNKTIEVDKIIELKYILEDGRDYVVTPGKFVTGIAEVKITTGDGRVITVHDKVNGRI